MVKIKLEDMRFEDSSMIDNCGRVFYYQDRVFRTISRTSINHVEKLLKNQNLKNFFQAGLIQTEIADIEFEGYQLVIEHKKIPFITYCSEWTSEMLKDALIMICKLSIELAINGYALKDTHTGNVLFEKCRPMYVDFGSIIPIEELGIISYGGIRDSYIFPLWLASKGYSDLATLIMKEHPNGVGRYLSHLRFINCLPVPYDSIVKKYLIQKKLNHQKAIITFYNNLKQYTEKIKINSKRSDWTIYEQDNCGNANNFFIYPQKVKTVYSLLEKMQRGTLLDMAAKKGCFSQMAANLGYKVVAFDYIETAVSEIYNKNKIDCKDILPLKMDFLYPTPNFNIGLANKPSVERLKCDTTLVLSLIHHLIFEQKMTFDVIAKIINQYTLKNSIVEFIPNNDYYVSKWITNEHTWYTIGNFINSMMRYFSNYTLFESSPAPRKIILFQK